MKKLAIITLFLIWNFSFAAFDYPARSAANAATGGSGSAASHLSGNFLLNPALSLNTLYPLSIGFSYFRLYNLPEFGYANAVATLRRGNYGMGLAIEHFGSRLYREETLFLNGARRFLNDKLTIGLTLKFYFLVVENYENASAAGADIGIRYRITERLSIGSAIENVNQPRINGYREELPQRMRLGIEYQPAKELYFYADLEKDAFYEPILAVGIAYQLYSNLFIRSGYNSAGPLPSVGLGLRVKGIQIDYATQYHFDLGATHFFGIHFLK